MTNPIANWWRCLRRASLTRQFRAALKLNNNNYANQLLKEIQRSGARLSLLERVFRDKLQSDQHSDDYKREVLALRQQVGEALDQKQELERSLEQTQQAVESLFRDKQQAEQSVAELRKRLAGNEQHIQDLRRHRNEVCEQNQNLARQIEQKRQGVENLSRSKRQVELSLTELRQEVGSLRRQQQVVQDLREQLNRNQQEFASAQRQLGEYKQQVVELREQQSQASQTVTDNLSLVPAQGFIESVENRFRLNETDEALIQCTGIDETIFNELEESLFKYLQDEFRKFPSDQLSSLLEDAFEDIDSLKRGADPQYNCELTSHVYFMMYFLENVYCSYLAWFLIYKAGVLSTKLNILDIAAGPGTTACGLALLLQSKSDLLSVPQTHISYYSLEQQASLQHHGLRFWRRHIESQQTAINTYFRFDTANIFSEGFRRLPQGFFDFIVISHCFFSDVESRIRSYEAYSKIFTSGLANKGYALLIIQDKKLLKTYNLCRIENYDQEKNLIQRFVEDLGLNLEWYKCITSTGRRVSSNYDFTKMARENNLPRQTHMSRLVKQHLRETRNYYALDDYVILARKERS